MKILLRKSLLIFAVLMTFAASSISYAATFDTESTSNDAAALSAEAIQTRSVKDAIADATQFRITDIALYRDVTDSLFGDLMTKIKRYLITQRSQRLQDESAPMPLAHIYNVMTTERVFSEFSAAQVLLMMQDIRRQSLSGYTQVKNVDSSSTTNPGAAPNDIALNGMLREKLDTIFCNPKSHLATDACIQKRAAAGIGSTENFIDFFIGTGTWQSKTILDVMLLNRSFYSTTLSRVAQASDGTNENQYIENQSRLAIDNLRMAVLDDLASRRAATSHATSSAMWWFFTLLAPSGQISGLDYTKVCAKDKPTTLENYACSFTSAPVNAKGDRAISQAALDKLLQYDMVMSPKFYEEINSTGYQATGSIQRLNVYLKAQQVSQDYRQLRLLQMKTAVRAMNILNRP